ncbi:hypothetical protein [Streptomyces paromomycinus]|uniref:Uncharacterized protein n=1 Tax=Streptomyces paromomycinus TaxID=92743 RepID=A0A401VY30_STREY|nr:hypothetical protein [Streptomyces paromomycinus]GCD41990.1 hypothetical protein GKJPGBOP_01648 [Streptomyces paromomycinus]
MKPLLLLSVLLIVFVVPTAGVWSLGRRAKIPVWMRAVFLPAGWLAVVVGGILAQRAHGALFPETSPCHRTGMPVTRYFPPDSFCLHDDGELRTVNGPAGKVVFWTAFGTAVAVPGAALVRRRPRS